MNSRLSSSIRFGVILAAVLFPIVAQGQWVADGAAVSTGPNAQSYPAIVSDGVGGAIVAWEDARTGTFDIYVQRLDRHGLPLWTPGGVLLCGAPYDQRFPSIVSDSAGGAIVGWSDYRDLPPDVMSGISASLSATSNIYAQRVNAAGNAQWIINGVQICAAVNNQTSPEVVSDGAGGAIMVWNDERSDFGDIYAQRVNALGSRLWTANGAPVCVVGGAQTLSLFVPTLVSDGSGGVIVAWYDGRGASTDIYAQRLNANGSPQWTSNGVALCTASSSQVEPAVATDAAGGAIVAWYDFRNGATDIFAQRVSALGAPQWTGGGVAITTALSFDQRPTVAPDGAGGAVISWGTTSQVYSQRVNAGGVPQWTMNGVLLGNGYNNGLVMSVPDGQGGAVVAWDGSYGSSSSNIIAQRVTSSGGVMWSANGVTICGAANGQNWPSIAVTDGASVMVTWQDERAGAPDVYAQRVSTSGIWGNPEPTITSVVDMPGDQGRFVRVRWSESSNTIPWYVYYVYRDDFGTWNYVGEVADNGGTTYSLVVPTLADSACNSPFGHNFKVISESTVSTEESNVVFGRSQDNIVPAAPVLTGQRVGNTVTLTWTRAATPDLQGVWSVYFSAYPGVAACAISCYFDAAYDTTFTASFGPPLGDMYWAVRAFDANCNFGVVSNEVSFLVPNTPVGTNATVNPYDERGSGAHPIVITFSNVTTEGRTSLEIGASGPSMPGGFTVGDSKYYNLTTTAGTSGSIEVCIGYDESALTVPEASLRMLHYDTTRIPPAWVDITSLLDTFGNVICGVTDHLSPFVIGVNSATSVPGGTLPVAFALYPSVPNPFNPQTTIEYDIPSGGADVNITIYDVAGRMVRELVNEHRDAGTWSVQWNGDDSNGQRVASGVYFYRMRAGEFVETRKMVLLK